MPHEIRTAYSIQTDFQTREDSDKPMISGYFAVFNSPYEFLPGYREFVSPNAFDDALSDDIRALINHDTSLVLGRTAVKTLRLRTDSHGLYGEIDVNKDDADAMNLYARVRRGDVSQCSFGFDILEEHKKILKKGREVDFFIDKVRLYEVSVCTFPAYQQTNVNARSALAARQDQIAALRKEWRDEQKNELRQILRAAHQKGGVTCPH